MALHICVGVGAVLLTLGFGAGAWAQVPLDDPEIRRILENLRQVYAAPPTLPPSTPVQTPAATVENSGLKTAPRPASIIAASALPPGGTGVPEGEELLVDLRVRGLTAARGLQAYKLGDGAMLPLAEVTGALFLPLEVQPAAGRAFGPILNNGERLELDLARGQVSFGRQSQKLEPGQAVSNGQDILVDSRLLGPWLGGTFKVDAAELQVTLNTERPFPTLERMAAHRQPGGAPPVLADGDKVDQETPYRVFSWPTIDFDTQASYIRARNGTSNLSGDLTTVGTNDFAYFQSQFFFSGSGSQNDGVFANSARATLIRDEARGNLPLGATRVELGEIQPAAVPLIGRGSFERGFRYSNRALGFGGRFDATDLIGDAPPGWDVDLFRNGALVASQQTTGSGRYNFSNVSLFPGNNNFKLVFYGPQGQVREETRIVPLGVGLAAPGRLDYDFSISQQDTPIYDPSRGTPLGAGAARASASLSYGLAEGLSALAGVTSFNGLDQRHVAYQSGLVAQQGDWLLVGNAGGDELGGWGYGASAQTSIYDQRVSLSQSYSNRLRLDPAVGVPRAANGFGASVQGLVPIGERSPLSYGLTYAGQRGRATNADNLSARLSYSFPGFSISQSLDAQRVSPEGQTSVDTIGGTNNVFLRLGNNLLRTGASYSLTPKLQFLNITAGTRLRFTPNTKFRRA